MKTLLIHRHAKSSWKHPVADHDRPLNKRGKGDAPRMGQLLRDEDLVPDLIISSTARRARRTAEFVADKCGYAEEILLARYFYHAGPEGFIEIVQGVSDEYEIVMVVGHNPCMEELVETLTGESARMTTANIAQVWLPIQCWGELDYETGGVLINLWRPKEL